MATKGFSEEKIRVTVKTYRRGFVLTGAVAALIGLFILLWPNVMGNIFSALIAIYALVAGAIYGYMAVRGEEMSMLLRVARGLVSLALIVGGILILIFMNTATAVIIDLVGVALGIMWIFEGLMALMIMRGRQMKTWVLIYVIVTIAIGVVMLLTPLWGGWPLQWLFGLSLLGLGIAQVVRGLTTTASLVASMDVAD